MAEQVGSIYYDVEFNTSKLLTGSKQVQAEVNKTAGNFGTLDRQVKTTTASMFQLSAAAAAVSAALATSQIVAYADAWANVNNKLANSVKVGEETAQVTERVFQVAQQTRSSLDATATLYSRLESATRAYNLSGEQVAAIATTINKAFIVSGATGAEAASSVVQLAQALGAGALRGEEFNSVNEQAPRLMQALADALGVTRGELKALAGEGRLTTEVVLKALQQQSDVIGTEFGNTIATFSQNMTVATNNVTKFVGSATVVQDAVRGLGKAFVVLSENIDSVLTVAGTLAAVIGVRMVAGFVAAAGAAGTLAAGMGALSTVMAFLGGPIGVIALAAVALFEFNRATNQGKGPLTEYREETEKLAAAFKSMGKEAQKSTLAQIDQQISGFQLEIRNLNKQTDKESQDRIDYLQSEIKLLKERRSALVGAGESAASAPAGKIELPAAKEKKTKAKKEQDRTINLANITDDQEEIDAAQDKINRILELNKTKDQLILDQEQASIEQINLLRAQDLINEQTYQDALLAIQQNAANQQIELMLERQQTMDEAAEEAKQRELERQRMILSSTADMFGNLAGLAEEFSGKQSSAFKVLFALSKGFAAANASLNLFTAISQALADPTAVTLPQKFANYAAIASAGGALISSIRGTTYSGARQYGGPVSADGMYKVGENGPEVFKAANGNNYMIPGRDGSVVSNDKIGGAAAANVIVNNYGNDQVTVRQMDDKTIIDIAAKAAVREVAGQITAKTGPVATAMSSATNTTWKAA